MREDAFKTNRSRYFLFFFQIKKKKEKKNLIYHEGMKMKTESVSYCIFIHGP